MAVNIYWAGPPQKNTLGGPTRLRPYYYFLFFFWIDSPGPRACARAPEVDFT